MPAPASLSGKIHLALKRHQVSIEWRSEAVNVLKYLINRAVESEESHPPPVMLDEGSLDDIIAGLGSRI